mmetsp:Transcript_119508/g.283730  ORF Transcript_119508/g.283730 Transcript_119508/m.283730 type:complete len:255 (+) Transcript_119508:1400-2164(+)
MNLTGVELRVAGRLLALLGTHQGTPCGLDALEHAARKGRLDLCSFHHSHVLLQGFRAGAFRLVLWLIVWLGRHGHFHLFLAAVHVLVVAVRVHTLQVPGEAQLQPSLDLLVKGDICDAKFHKADGVNQRRVVGGIGVIDMQPDNAQIRYDVELLLVLPAWVAVVVDGCRRVLEAVIHKDFHKTVRLVTYVGLKAAGHRGDQVSRFNHLNLQVGKCAEAVIGLLRMIQASQSVGLEVLALGDLVNDLLSLLVPRR